MSEITFFANIEIHSIYNILAVWDYLNIWVKAWSLSWSSLRVLEQEQLHADGGSSLAGSGGDGRHGQFCGELWLTQLWRWREAWSSDDVMGKVWRRAGGNSAWLPPRNLRLDETGGSVGSGVSVSCWELGGECELGCGLGRPACVFRGLVLCTFALDFCFHRCFFLITKN